MAYDSSYITIATNKSMQNATINAQTDVTFFKFTTRAHTLFGIAKNTVSLTNFQFGSSGEVEIYKQGDMLYEGSFQFSISQCEVAAGSTVAYTHHLGFAMFEELCMNIGSQEFDKHTGQWMYIWANLTMTDEELRALEQCIGHRDELINNASATLPAVTLIVPLFFWFCRRPSLALPLAAMDFSNIQMKYKIRPVDQLVIVTGGGAITTVPAISQSNLFFDYIQLSAAEHDALVDSNIDMVYEFVQTKSLSPAPNQEYNSILQLSHPTKFLVFTAQKSANVDSGANRWTDFSDSGASLADAWTGDNPVGTARLDLYSSSVEETRPGLYFNQYIPMKKFKRPAPAGVNVYSWALDPVSSQPSGTLNFSHVEQAALNMGLTDTDTKRVVVHAFAYNTLVITNGSIGKVFSS